MASFNKVILMGNLTQDPELRTAPSGAKVCDLRMAVNETWTDKTTGQPKEVVCYVDVSVWNRAAENCAQYLSKGRSVLVEGRLQMDQWTTKEGEKRSRIRVRADSVKFLSSGPRRDNNAPASAPQQTPPPAVENVDPVASDDEDLPF